MKIQLIRNATMKLHYGNSVILIDPYLGKKYSQPPFAGKSLNPTVDLPFSATEVLSQVDLILVSHLHPDHFDAEAEAVIDKSSLLFCQPGDYSGLSRRGFTNVHKLDDTTTWNGITITRTPGKHGYGSRLEMMGKVSGFILQHPEEPTVYWMGDTVWYNEVQGIIKNADPDIIVTHSCGALWAEGELPVIMNAEQTIEVCQFAPKAKIVATHMEALDLATVSRKDLRIFAEQRGITDLQLFIPRDGEILDFK